MPKHRAGGKYTGSHTTIIEAAEVVVDTAAKQEEVSKIVLGVIEIASSKKTRLKFQPVQAGLKLVVYGRVSLQIIFVYTTDTEKTQCAIEKAFK